MYAVISDVHSNLEALTAVLDDIPKRAVRGIFFLGDSVGYGPDPDKCISLLKDRCQVLLAGNHDWAVIGYTSVDYFNEYARAAVEWTVEHLAKEKFEFLKALKIVKVMEEDDLFLVHSSPKEPDIWHYVTNLYEAYVNFHYFDQKICLVGHSHTPFIIESPPSGKLKIHRSSVQFSKGSRYIVNVGSIGQPRDGDPRAAYALLTTEGVEITRIEYDFRKTQEKMKKAGLPEFLIQRLARGE